MAEEGLRYNRFHVTALCSPTRAALLTGRNNHAVGFGSIGEFSTGFPGYTAFVPEGLRAVAEDPAGQRLQHRRVRQVAPDARRPAGPGRAVRPLAERLGVRLLLRASSAAAPASGTRASPRTRRSSARRRASTTSETRTTCPTTWRTRRSSGCTASGRRTPSKPFFVYFSTGCSHAPHHVPKEWADKYKGKFDQGWDRLREETFARQKAARRDPRRRRADAARRGVPRLGRRCRTSSRRFYARQMEVYAGYSENADYNVGRVHRRDRRAGRARQHARHLDLGRQRRQHGGHAHRLVQRADDAERHPADRRDAAPARRAVRRHGGVGQPRSWRRTTRRPGRGPATRPFQWGKQVGSHLGGTRNPMVVHWPERITDGGGAAVAVHARDRHRRRRSSTSPGSRRRPTSTASSRSRCTA